MPLTRLDNLLSSKTGKYVYVSPDDFNASDSLDNRGNSPTRPFLSIQRAFLEVARFSYAPGLDNDRFDEFTIMLSPGVHHIDNRPGVANVDDLPIFQYNQSLGEWETNSNVSFNLADPNNILYKFNGRDGGATIPRGTSLVGMDLRRTQLRPLYVPDPADKDVPRCALFNVTGGCYFWQFTIQDGDLSSNSPLYDATAGVGKVYTQPQDFVNKAVPEFSHHKITNFVFADRQDLGLLYRKISHVFSDFQPDIDNLYVDGQSSPVTEYWSSSVNYTIGSKVIYNGDAYISTLASTNSRPNISPNNWTLLVIRNREFDFRVQENRIVGPLQDAVRIDEIRIDDSSPAGIATITVRTKINHEFFPGQYVAITNNGLNNTLNGVFKVYAINATDPKVFTYKIATTATGLGLVSGNTYTSITLPALDTNSTVQAEIDSVESASPYVFNVSIRSTWGICGIWADGRKATGFKSMVIAQYTGVSLQKDDRAFIRYDEFSNTWNQASLTDAFATTPYHIKGDAFWKDDWRNFHVKASDDSFIQCVSIFAVGFADHFLMESGGDMSITNSNSNFGNTSLHAIGYKGFAFNQDKGGYITDIIPPKSLSSLITTNQQYYTLDVPLSRGNSLYPNATKLYISSDDARSAENRPSSSVNGYRLGAKRNEKLFVKLDATGPKSAELIHSGFKKWTSSVSSIGPVGAAFTPEYNSNQDAAQLIDDNKLFIQEEAFGYILEKYPTLQSITYVNPNSETSKCKRDIGYIVEAIVSDLKLGGNINTINAAESYYTANQLDYINNETTETLDAYRYVRNLAISAMRNHNTYIINASTTSGSSIVTVPSTIGLVMGMKVRSVISVPTSSSSIVTYSNNIPSNAYIKKIGDGTNGLQTNQIQLGNLGSKFDFGTNINATATSSVVNLYVEFSTGVWESNLSPVVNNTITQDYGYSTPIDLATGSPGGECSSVASSIVNFYQIFATIINSGIGSIPRIESSTNTSLLAQRATLFTLVEYDSSGIPTTNPHQLETGTPVKLVPKAKSGAIVDKKLIRLPKGFDSNTLYYVIAPGRKTDPYDYSTTSSFNGSNQQTFLLATSEENANAGIYIYSSETNDINSNIQIDVYQYVLDINYDLHQYQTTLLPGSSNILEANRPHSFDITVSNVEPQLVFFRVGSDIVSSSLPVLSNTFGGVTISSKRFYYVRYITSKTFSIYETFANARDNINPVSFQPGSTAIFYTFANKRRSPLRYDPSIGSTNSDGCWYIETLSATNTIIPRIKLSDYASRRRTNDSFFTRIEDKRTKEDRIYRLRYVIPKNLKAVRDPLRGFVIKIRTDEKRRLLPQKIILKPTSTGSSVATFLASGSGEKLGLTLTEQLVLDPNFSSTYDPSPFGNPKRIETNSKISFTIQSARKILSGGNNYLQITAFDVGVDAEAFKTKLFTTVKISAPQGGTGSFVSSIPNSNTTNRITWSGNSSGSAYVHGYFSYQNEYYMILKDFGGNSVLEYKSNVDIIFTQGITSSTLLESPNSGRNLLANNQYVVDGANVYTLTVGDTINDDNGVSYTIASVEDVSDMEDTFYIFDINTIRKRIPGQQDGIYYLTCVKGNISPYPTGSGVGENFRKFKFSQPISKLYPESYKNDPEWYKGIDVTSNTLLDPPATISTADNYVHGLVTVNDSKNNLTKETILDFITDPGSGGYIYAGNSAIQAQSGSASAGSESRRIKISGNSLYPTEGKLYVELRRPSIARSGNHTFEYLGFGPGNYSTGFPARQEVVLTDIQDFYAQSKKQDGGIVFYTGLNSNGDLYIGNRKINAITGEETFLESAKLIETPDEDDIGDSISDTFEVPVTFNSTITVNGEDNELESFFNCPVVINNPSNILSAETLPSLTIVTGEGSVVGYDPYLEYNIAQQKTGDVVIHQGRVAATVLDFNPRGLQEYQITTALSNVTPDLDNYYGSSTGGLSQLQNTNFGTRFPLTSGLIQLKGSQTLFTGSLGWIYTSDYIRIENRSNTPFVPRIAGIQGSDTGSLVTLYWSIGITNNTLDIGASSQIRITNAVGALAAINGVWPVYNTVASPFEGTAQSVKILVNTTLPAFVGSPLGYSVDQIAQPTIVIEKSKSAFKEVGVIGSEAIRTETDTIGDYKIGINTVARSPHSSYQTAFVSSETTPRANLDVVGTAFISGKKILNYVGQSVIRTETSDNNALLVGGDSNTPNNEATLRVSTTNGGRVGINVTHAELDRNLVVDGNAKITSDFELTGDLQVNGGDLTTSSNAFNLLNTTAPDILNFAGGTEIFNIGNNSTGQQSINIGGSSTKNYLLIGNSATETSLQIHSSSLNAVVDIASVSDLPTSSCDITIGGAYSNANSQTKIKTRQTILSGSLQIGAGLGIGSVVGSDIFTLSSVANIFNTSDTNTINLGNSATNITIASVGGNTTIRNTLNVLASANVDGNIKLRGGINAGIIKISRAKFGTSIQSHQVGSLASPNIDYYKYESTGILIDTAGVSQWGGLSSIVGAGQISVFDTIVNTGGSFRNANTYSLLSPSVTSAGGGVSLGTGAVFTITIGNDLARTPSFVLVSPGVNYAVGDILTFSASQLGGGVGAGTLTTRVSAVVTAGNDYYLPISTPGAFSFQIGDLILIDRGNAASPDSVVVSGGGSITGLRNQENSEIVRVTGLTNLSNPSNPQGFRVQVSRGQEGTQVKTDHPDGCVLAKLVKQSNASFITGADINNNGVIDIPAVGIGVTPTTDVNIGVAEFGGIITTNDYLRLSGSEIVSITAIVATDIQVLEINDGSSNPATVFKVESTSGNTIIAGNLGVGVGFDRFTVNGTSGNTTVAGTLTTEGTLKINGSTSPNTEFFTITNGGSGNSLRTTFQIDTATGDLRLNGGNINVFDTTGTIPRLTVNNSSGDFTTFGSFSALGTGKSRFGGDIVARGDLYINGGDITVNTGAIDFTATTTPGSSTITNVVVTAPATIAQLVVGMGVFTGPTFGLDIPIPTTIQSINTTTGEIVLSNFVSGNTGTAFFTATPAESIFKVKNDGSLRIAKIDNYITSTGGRKWLFESNSFTAQPNINYFVSFSGNSYIALPTNALIGDMIRIIDIGGNLTYNISIIVRAPTNVKIQNAPDNTATTYVTAPATHNGGELVVQTPNAAFGLVYAGSVNPHGTGSAVPSGLAGWYLIEV